MPSKSSYNPLKPHSFLPTSHLPVTPKCMQVPSFPCISPPTNTAHDLLPMGLRVYWGEWCGQTSWLYISRDTQRPTPQRRCLPDTINHDPERKRTHLSPHNPGPPASHSHTRGTTTASHKRSHRRCPCAVTGTHIPVPAASWASLHPQMWEDQCGQVSFQVIRQADAKHSKKTKGVTQKPYFPTTFLMTQHCFHWNKI